MKLKTSFFNWTVFKKDIVRYFPAWLVYCIAGLLLSRGSLFGLQENYYTARQLAESTGFMSIIHLGYAMVIAMLVFGDLFKSRMCNALHALPIRRESWFVTHTAAALAMGIAPNLLVTLLMVPSLGGLWYIAFLWLAMMTMAYIFFLGLAIFSMLCVGRRFAAATMYLLLNFGAMLVRWIVNDLIMPHLYGVVMRPEPFNLFSPVVHLFSLESLWTLKHAANCSCRYHYDYVRYHDVSFQGYGEGWGYLWILLAVGVAALVGALALYRRRQLERAGDFVAVKSLKTVLSLIAAVFAGMIFSLFGGYVLLVLGMPVGFFLCRMLLERRVKVFGGKNWLRLVALMAAFAIFIGLGVVDVLGITRRVPDIDRVESVTVAESFLSSWELDQVPRLEASGEEEPQLELLGVDPNYHQMLYGMLTLYDREDIQTVMQIHQLMWKEVDARELDDGRWQPVTIHYVMKDGTTLTRYYYPQLDSEALQQLRGITNTPKYILGVQSWQELRQDIARWVLYLPDGDAVVVPASWLDRFAQATFQDAEEGNLRQEDYGTEVCYMTIRYAHPDETYGDLELQVFYQAKNLRLLIQQLREEMKEQPVV